MNDTTGAHGLSIDPQDPSVLYAATWDYRVKPWFYRSGGPGSGLWKTTDGGGHWTHLQRGLPSLMGNTDVAVSPVDPNRVYAIIEAVHGGVFRSDDAGETWTRVNSDEGLRARAWYYTLIYADPRNKNVVYVLGNTMGKSVNGGRTFAPIEPPHGDHHDLWINPLHPNIMAEGNDGGGTVTLNGGRTWSTEYNQPTGQFYRVFADKQNPYRLYGGQQDQTSLRVPSQTTGFGIGTSEVGSVGGGESAQVSMDAADPRLVYATGLLGTVTVHDQQDGVTRQIDPWPNWAGYRNADSVKYRFSWSPPVVVARGDPKTVYVGAQVVLRTRNEGETWTAISPDLTRHDKSKEGTPSGPISYGGGAGYWSYDVITYIEQSPAAHGVIWVGTDDGMVHVTRNGGETWANVTPAGMKNLYVHSIDASPTNPAVAYVAANGLRLGDFRPEIFRTDDYGRTWELIVDGIPRDDIVTVVREDPTRSGIVYAGTDKGVFISFNSGSHWQPFQQNLPIVPITDLKVRDNDLIASTQGRGFWILDDLTPLYQMTDARLHAEAYLYKPSTAYLASRSYTYGAAPYGSNPPRGLLIRYNLSFPGRPATAPVTLTIEDEHGHVIRRFTDAIRSTESGLAFQKGVISLPPAPPVPTHEGMNAYVWDLRVGPYTRTADIFRNVSQIPYRVGPGIYTAVLTYPGGSMAQRFHVDAPPADQSQSLSSWNRQQQLLASLRNLVNDINATHNRMRSIALGVHTVLSAEHASRAIASDGKVVLNRIGCWEQQFEQPQLARDVQDYVSFPSRSWAIPVLHLISVVDQGPPITASDVEVAQALRSRWGEYAKAADAIVQGPVLGLSDALTKAGAQPVPVAPGSGASPAPVVRVEPWQCHKGP